MQSSVSLKYRESRKGRSVELRLEALTCFLPDDVSFFEAGSERSAGGRRIMRSSNEGSVFSFTSEASRRRRVKV